MYAKTQMGSWAEVGSPHIKNANNLSKFLFTFIWSFVYTDAESVRLSRWKCLLCCYFDEFNTR